MLASSSAASSTLTRTRIAVLVIAGLTAACSGYYAYSNFLFEPRIEALPGTGLQRSNAVHRRNRRRRRQADTNNGPTALFEDDEENVEDGHIVSLADGATVVGDEDDAFERPPAQSQRNGQNIVQLLFRVSEDATRRNAYVHRGCACNSCGVVPIRGIRYRCSNCADYDLCEGCESQGLHIKTHIFYKIRVPGPSFGPKNIQPVWYAGDPDAVMRVLPKEITTKLSHETGFERPELDAYWEQWTFMASTDWRDDPDDINLAMDRKTFERCLVPSGGYRHTSPSLIFDRMFAFYDTNKDDIIGFPEFLHGIGYRKKKDKWSRIFEGYDIDGDGYVDRKDFLRMFRSYYVLYRQMHRDMLEGMEEQHMSCTEAHRLVTSRQPLSSAFGQDGRYPRAPDPHIGQGKIVRVNGDMEITDGKGVMNANSGDIGNREDIFRQNIMTLNRYHQLLRETNREGEVYDSGANANNGGYWETMIQPPQNEADLSTTIRNMRRLREQAEDILQGRINTRESLDIAVDEEDETKSQSDAESETGEISSRGWIPTYVTVTDEDAEAIEGPGKTVDDIQPKYRQTVIAHAMYRERAQRDIYDRWKRRQFYTDEEEGAVPPEDWDADDDVLAHSNMGGESSKSPARPSIHSRSSSKVRFAEDMDDFDTRSNPSTSSRSVPERWGGMEIPDAERDAGKEILYQVTQQAFNELLDPLFKKKEDLAVQAAETSEKRERYRNIFTTPSFEQWALEREAEDYKRAESKERTRTTAVQEESSTHSTFPSFPEVEVEEVRQRPLQELLAATGFEVDSDAGRDITVSARITADNESMEQVEAGNAEVHQNMGSVDPSRAGAADQTTRNGLPSPIAARHTEARPTITNSADFNEQNVGFHGSMAAQASPIDQEAWPLHITAGLDALRALPMTPIDHGQEFVSGPLSPDSSPQQDTPPSVSSSSSYRDPTLPQFRPNALPVFAPRFSRFAEDLPEVDELDDLSLPPTPKLLYDNRPPREVLYQLWRSDRATKEAEARGGWGRLNFEEFEALVKQHVRKGKGAKMDYLGSWIDLCIP